MKKTTGENYVNEHCEIKTKTTTVDVISIFIINKCSIVTVLVIF
jgi:hypothetical protein